VWLFGTPAAGFLRVDHGRPGAFWCIHRRWAARPAAGRRFIIMGFNMSGPSGRCWRAFASGRVSPGAGLAPSRGRPGRNLWRQFILYDRSLPAGPIVATLHFAPNSVRDYDGATKVVPSNCDDWLTFPTMLGTVRHVNCADGGNGESGLITCGGLVIYRARTGSPVAYRTTVAVRHRSNRCHSRPIFASFYALTNSALVLEYL